MPRPDHLNGGRGAPGAKRRSARASIVPSPALKKVAASAILDDPITAAKAAWLRHVNDDSPGITRHKAQYGFDYRDIHGELISDVETLSRIKSLAISAGMDGCVDLSFTKRPHPGDRPRRARTQAISLSPALARNAR